VLTGLAHPPVAALADETPDARAPEVAGAQPRFFIDLDSVQTHAD